MSSVKSVLLEGSDYGSDGMYFITICAENSKYYFWNIIDKYMQLSEIRIITQIEWYKTLKICSDINLQFDAFIIIPNHIHGIIIIGDNKYNSGDMMDCCCKNHDGDGKSYKNSFSPQSKIWHQ